LQSYAGFIEILPAVPAEWKDISFENLRAEGAFLVSIKKTNGRVSEVKIVSEKGGNTRVKLPFKTWTATAQKDIKIKDTHDGFISLNCKPGAMLVLKNTDSRM
jgi:hypothetical protein